MKFPPPADAAAASPAAKSGACVLLFLAAADLAFAEVARELSQGFKASATLAAAKQLIHLIVNVPSLDVFDKSLGTLSVPRSVQVWADVGGTFAKAMGVKPMLEEIDVHALFQTAPAAGTRPNRMEQVQPCLFAIMAGEIVKSPAFQPKFQGCSVSTLKALFTFLQNQARWQKDKIVAADSFGPGLNLDMVKRQFPDAWKAFLEEGADPDIKITTPHSTRALIESATTATAAAPSAPAAAPVSSATDRKASSLMRSPATIPKEPPALDLRPSTRRSPPAAPVLRSKL